MCSSYIVLFNSFGHDDAAGSDVHERTYDPGFPRDLGITSGSLYLQVQASFKDGRVPQLPSGTLHQRIRKRRCSRVGVFRDSYPKHIYARGRLSCYTIKGSSEQCHVGEVV